MADRQKRLLALIEQANGRAAYIGDVQEEGEDAEALHLYNFLWTFSPPRRSFELPGHPPGGRL